MLSGKAIARAIRGLFLIDTALHCLLGSELFDINLPSSVENDSGDQTSLDSENNAVLEEASKTYSQLESKTLCTEAVLDHPVLKQLHFSFKGFLVQTVDTVFGNDTYFRSFLIRAEMTGDLNLHLRALQDM